MGKIKKAAKARSEGGGRGGRRKTAATSNGERNFKQETLAAMATIGYVLANPSYKNYLQRISVRRWCLPSPNTPIIFVN